MSLPRDQIIGFDFRASLTMDMREEVYDDEFKGKKLYFTLVESRMFNAFDGNWRVQVHSREKVP